MRLQDAGGSIDRVALPNRTQIQGHRHVTMAESARHRVQHEIGAVTACDVKSATRIAPHLHGICKQWKRFIVERDGFKRGGPIDMRNPAVRSEAAQPRMPVFNLAKRELSDGLGVHASVVNDRQLEPRTHGGRGEPDDARRSPAIKVAQSRLTFSVRGLKPNAPPSQNERWARSTMTITIVPSSTSLRGFWRVRMQSIQ